MKSNIEIILKLWKNFKNTFFVCKILSVYLFLLYGTFVPPERQNENLLGLDHSMQ